MSIRSLDLLDLPNLYRMRGEAVSLDTARTLTRGSPLGAVGLLAYVNPARHIYSAIANGEDGASVLGGIIHTRSESFARLLYLAPASCSEHPQLPALIENLSAEAGGWGVFHVLAEVDETSDVFAALRRAGFSVYAWQRMWNIGQIAGSASGAEWKRMKSVHLPSIQNLYHQIVPPLLQPVEPIPEHAFGWISDEGPRCYASSTAAVYGIALTPLIHPDAADVGGKLASLVNSLPDRRNRPVYLRVRSYQAWLEPVLEDYGASAGPRQAVMVKHLARLVKDGQTSRNTRPANVSVQPSRVSRMEKHKS